MRTWNGFGLRGSQKSEQSWAQLVQSGDFAPSPAPFATPWGVMRGQAQGHRHQQHTRRSHGRPVRSGFCIHPPRGPYLASESQSALCLDQVSSWTNHWLGPMISETEWGGSLLPPLSPCAPSPAWGLPRRISWLLLGLRTGLTYLVALVDAVDELGAGGGPGEADGGGVGGFRVHIARRDGGDCGGADGVGAGGEGRSQWRRGREGSAACFAPCPAAPHTPSSLAVWM